MKVKSVVILSLTVIIIIGGIVLASESGSLLKEGDRAPDFTSRLSTGEVVSLQDYHGKSNVVLFFYPKDFTPGCTKQVCSFRDNYNVLERHDAVLLGVSFDGEKSHGAFIEKHNLPFPLISDTDKSISRAYAAADRLGGLLPGSKRVTYVIDKQGIIRAVLHHEIMISRHVDGVIDALKKIESEGG